MKSIKLKNGFEYKSFWGGQERRPQINARRGITQILGPFSTPRQYHELELLTVEGKDWIFAYQKQAEFPHDTFDHYEHLSTCGHYKISRYPRPNMNSFYFLAYECCTWRANLASTFGNHVQKVGAQVFGSFKEAARAVSIATKKAA